MFFCLLSNTPTTSTQGEDAQKTPGELCWAKHLLVILLNNCSWLPFSLVFFFFPPTNMSHSSIIWNPLRAESASVHFVFPGMSCPTPSMESAPAGACGGWGDWPGAGGGEDLVWDRTPDSPGPDPPLGDKSKAILVISFHSLVTGSRGSICPQTGRSEVSKNKIQPNPF